MMISTDETLVTQIPENAANIESLILSRRLTMNKRKHSKKKTPTPTNASWLLHHNNAPAHSSLYIRDFCDKTTSTVIPRLPYSSGHIHADFFLFWNLKFILKGQRLDTIDEIKEKSPKKLRVILHEAYHDCFMNWKLVHWRQDVNKGGQYFEDKVE